MNASERAFQKKSLEFLMKLSKVIRDRQMYNEKHPVVLAGMEKAEEDLRGILASTPSLIFGKGNETLLIQNQKITEKNIIAEQFLRQMAEREIGKVIIKRGVMSEELEALVTLMSAKRDHVLIDSKINPELLLPFKNIEIDEVEFISTEDLEDMTEAKKFFDSIFKEEFKGLKGTDALQKIGSVIQKILPQLAEKDFENEDDEIRDFFEMSIESFGGGDISKTKQSLQASLRTMDPEVQKLLFGGVIKSDKEVENIIKNFSGERKASIIAEEVSHGQDLSKALDSLVTENGDIVQLAEEIAKKFGVQGGEDSQEKMSKIFGLLQQLDRNDIIIDKKRGNVLIAEVEEGPIKTYQDFFTQLRFEIEVVNDGKVLLERITKSKEQPDLIVMDAKLPEMSGIEVLRTLDSMRVCIPTIICTDMVSAKESFEVQMHRKLDFHTKTDLAVENLLPFIDEHCPPIVQDDPIAPVTPQGHPELSEEMKAELKKAREIQRNLMPKTFPEIEGLEIYSYYKAYDMIGGDYFDVIKINDNKIGFLIADVSGHGITGAMVMVMVRSAVQTWAPHCESPKQLLEKVNPMVARDILPGFFCTVYYGVLDIEKRELCCSCAGHNPAVIWRHRENKCIETKKGGMPLGILSGNAFNRTLREEVIQLEAGDRFILFTDGLVETMCPDQEEYGEERLFGTIAKGANFRSDAFTKYIVCGVLRHQNTGPQHDDLTMLSMRVV
ncbi:SpoIIE family protein phosphatase [Candidatus Uabimicrobium sp. HlEnr_7]|uniref:SpoIIE family protein phosphatase n=1 Tax=Candidatus Uabimicrobium helgolandensis TaxID=3095367 RepID=UPI003555C4BC